MQSRQGAPYTMNPVTPDKKSSSGRASVSQTPAENQASNYFYQRCRQYPFKIGLSLGSVRVQQSATLLLQALCLLDLLINKDSGSNCSGAVVIYVWACLLNYLLALAFNLVDVCRDFRKLLIGNQWKPEQVKDSLFHVIYNYLFIVQEIFIFCNNVISEFICFFQCMDSLYFTVEIMIAGMVIIMLLKSSKLIESYNIYTAAMIMNGKFYLILAITLIYYMKKLFCEGNNKKQRNSPRKKGQRAKIHASSKKKSSSKTQTVSNSSVKDQAK